MLHHRIIGTGKPIFVLHGVYLGHRYMMDHIEPGFRESETWKKSGT